jgi:hypothetical protein
MSIARVACESRIERVVVYARGAVVTRRVALPRELAAGPIDLVVAGVTAGAEMGTLAALAEGEREVVAVSSRLVVPGGAVDRGALAAEVRELDLAREELEARKKARAARRAELAALAPAPDLAKRARRVDPVERVESALALGGLVAGELARLDAAIQALDDAITDNRRAREAAELAAAQGRPDEVAGARSLHEVTVRLGAGGALSSLAIEYVVAAARFWPAYSARFSAGATKVRLALDAHVAQDSGEDWSGVRLSLSTADLAHDARLPELASLRIGRAQPPARRGWRAPPEGLDALFAGYDRVTATVVVHTSTTVAVAVEATSADLLAQALASRDDEDERTMAGLRRAYDAPMGAAAPQPARAELAASPAVDALRGRHAAPGFGAPPAPSAAPMAQGFAMPAPAMAPRSKSLGGFFGGFGGGGLAEEAEAGAPPEPELPAAVDPGDEWLDFDALALGDPADRARRGRLVRAPSGREGAASKGRAIDALAGPEGVVDPAASRGLFDHRYDAEGTCDVPSTGRPHRVSVTAADAPATPRFTAVPRESAEVYREAEVENPLDAPLPAGPVDVFLDGALVTTASVAAVDRGGRLRVGLGVEERLRIARNARVEEGSAGLLGGSTTVDHAVTVELASSLGRDVDVDVLERVPVSDDKDVEVKLSYARPEPQKYKQLDRGAPLRKGLAFRVRVPAAGKAKIELGYRVTLPAKLELVGGNRRE